MISWFKRTLMFNIAARFCGYHDYDSFKEHKKEALNAFDMLDMIDENDPPIYLMNLLKGWFPKKDNIMQHHVKHAKVVARHLRKHEVKHFILTRSRKI